MPTVSWEDTIVGPATPAGAGVVGILRITGPRTHDAVEDCLSGPADFCWSRPFVADVRWSLRAWSREVPITLYSWPDGRSYTGQQTVELHYPCSAPLAVAIQTQLAGSGVRLARPGEFTLRAFLSGRLDLAQAEGVLGLIESEDIDQLRQAIDQRTGGLSRPVTGARDRLLDLLADLEAGLDFVDEDIAFVTAPQVERTLADALAQLSKLSETMTRRVLECDRARIVLVGEPNAGKSSLFNALARRHEALVSRQAGTTRDYLVTPIQLGEQLVELVDTAGLEALGQQDASSPGPDATESAAIARQSAQQRDRATQSADLVACCVPVNEPVPKAWARSTRVLFIRTKCDLDSSYRDPQADGYTSVLQPATVDRLALLLGERLRQVQRAPADKPMARISERCCQGLAAAVASLQEALTMQRDDAGPELVAMVVREVLGHLGAIVGEVYTEDLLDRVFSRFCIGK